MYKKTFTEFINEARREKRITIKQLSDMCGVSASTMNRLLAGGSIPTLDIAVRMANAVDVPLDKVFGLNPAGKQIANPFLMISNLITTQVDGQYAANFDQEHKTIIITPNTFHGAIDFEAWAKLVDLYRQNIIPKEMYDAWVEKKSDSLSDFKQRKDDNR